MFQAPDLILSGLKADNKLQSNENEVWVKSFKVSNPYKNDICFTGIEMSLSCNLSINVTKMGNIEINLQQYLGLLRDN